MGSGLKNFRGSAALESHGISPLAKALRLLGAPGRELDGLVGESLKYGGMWREALSKLWRSTPTRAYTRERGRESMLLSPPPWMP